MCWPATDWRVLPRRGTRSKGKDNVPTQIKYRGIDAQISLIPATHQSTYPPTCGLSPEASTAHLTKRQSATLCENKRKYAEIYGLHNSPPAPPPTAPTPNMWGGVGWGGVGGMGEGGLVTTNIPQNDSQTALIIVALSSCGN